MLNMLLLAVFPLLVIYAALYDFRHYRITNKFNLVLLLSFFPVALLAGMPWQVMLDHLISFAVVLAAVFLLFALTNKFGGGDAKMIAAAAIWIDFEMVPLYIVAITLAGAVLGGAMWLWRFVQVEIGVWGNRDGAATRKVLMTSFNLPYGAAIAAGGIIAFSQSWWQNLLMG
jgi:prepilin peptidase CpaA